MKFHSGFKQRTVLFSVVFLLSLFIWACGGGSQQQVQERQLEEVKQDTELEIRQLLNDINERLEVIEDEMEEASGEIEEELEEAHQELLEQREIIEAEIEKVQNASLDTWEQVRISVSQKYNEARTTTNDVSRRVRDMLDQE